MNNHKELLPLLLQRKQRIGITLIELLFVLAIVAILVTLSVPLFTNFIQNYRLTSAAEDLLNSIAYARSESIKQSTPVYISFNTGDTWCYGLNSGSSCDCTNPSSCNLGTTSYQVAQQLSLTTSGLTSNTLYFKSIHSGASTSGNITFTAYGQSAPLITISISRLGNPQVCATGISGYTAC